MSRRMRVVAVLVLGLLLRGGPLNTRSAMTASKGDLQGISEIGPKVFRSVTTFFGDEYNRQEIEEMCKAGLKLSNPLYTEAEQPRPLEGMTFMFTGALERWTRDEAKRLVEELGGWVTSSVSGESDHVVAGPGAGGKLAQAEARGVPVWDEEAFGELLEQRSGGLSP